MRGNRLGAAKTLLDVNKEDANGVGGTSENKPTKEKKKSGARGEGARIKRKRKRRPKTAEIDDEQARKEAARRKGYNFNRAFFAKRCQSEERKKESLTPRFFGRE